MSEYKGKWHYLHYAEKSDLGKWLEMTSPVERISVYQLI